MSFSEKLGPQSGKLQLMWRINEAFWMVFNRIYFVKNRDVSRVLNAGTPLLKCNWFKASVMSGCLPDVASWLTYVWCLGGGGVKLGEGEHAWCGPDSESRNSAHAGK